MKPARLFAFLVLTLPTPGKAIPPPRYFPLDPGKKWTYSLEGHPGREAVVSVLGVEGELYRLNIRGTEVRIGGTPDVPLIELPEGGFHVYYRFQEDSFVHRDVFGCDDKTILVAVSREEVADTPAGSFEHCLRLDYTNGSCVDAGTISEWWKLDVGKVKWIEDSIAGPRVWLLESVGRVSKPGPFLRGDANGDQKVDVSDSVFVLLWLFSSGLEPSCEDAADANDDGVLNIADPIFALNFLFLGAAPPGPPGPFVPGFDGTPDDPFLCGDALPCNSTSSSTLPGVSIDLSENPCVLTLSQAADGVSFFYRTKIERDLPGTTTLSLDAGRCDQPDESGLAVLELISGGGQGYCLCDVGPCFLQGKKIDLVAGVFENRFEWDGRNWGGPSDTSNPKGPAFPPGDYQFSVKARGTYLDPEGVEQPYEVSASVGFHLAP